MNVEIPVNTTAKIHFPTSNFSDIEENNTSISKNAGIKILESNDEETILQLGVG